MDPAQPASKPKYFEAHASNSSATPAISGLLSVSVSICFSFLKLRHRATGIARAAAGDDLKNCNVVVRRRGRILRSCASGIRPFALVTPHDLNPDAVVAVGAVTVKVRFVESLEFSVHLASSFSRRPPVSGSVVNGLSIGFSVETRAISARILLMRFAGLSGLPSSSPSHRAITRRP